MENFDPERVRRIKWANGAEVVSVIDYERLLELYRALLPAQITIEEKYGTVHIE
jgi:hypothetical protein